MEKKTFDFYQEVKVKVWKRQHFSIEAETEEEARELAKQCADKDVYDCDDIEIDNDEWLYDTGVQITPEENRGCATIEVYDFFGKLLAHNAKKEFSELK